MYYTVQLGNLIVPKNIQFSVPDSAAVPATSVNQKDMWRRMQSVVCHSMLITAAAGMGCNSVDLDGFPCSSKAIQYLVQQR